jgi:hypothetical protein
VTLSGFLNPGLYPYVVRGKIRWERKERGGKRERERKRGAN